MLLLTDVDRHILAARVLADNHPLIHRNARAEEQHTPLLGILQGIGSRFTRLPGHKRTGRAGHHRPGHFVIAVEDRMHHARAARGRQELVAEPKQAACRDDVDHARHALTGILHVHHPAAPRPEHFHHRADSLIAGLDVDLFERLEQRAVISPMENDFRPRDLEFIAFTPHRFDQDAQVQLTAPRNEEVFSGFGLLHPQGNIGSQLLEQALAQAAGASPLPFPARKG